MAQKLDYIIIDLLESTARNIKSHPLGLGGFGGAGGGVGSPPGGFIGWLPQTRVAYDTDELATLATLPSGLNPPSGWSLVDNLNHIRYRLQTIESGILIVDDWDGNPTIHNVTEITFSGAIVTQVGAGHALVVVSGGAGSALTVEEADGSPSVNNVNKIIFSGATVTDLGGGEVKVTVSGGGNDSTYLRLDGTNDPITGPIVINITDFPPTDTIALSVIANDPLYNGIAFYAEAHNNYAGQVTAFNYGGFAVNQEEDDGLVNNNEALGLYRYSDAPGAAFTRAALLIADYISNAVFSGGSLRHELDGAILVDINPYATNSGIFFNTHNTISDSNKLVSIRNNGTEKFAIAGDGRINIPTSATYDVNGTPHTHDYEPSDGWLAGTGTWSYSSADNPTGVISINADVTGLIGVGCRIKLTQTTVKYFIVTVVGAYSGGVTLVTVYGGTDYTLANAAITNPFYSHDKYPFGFPSDPAKWTVEFTDTNLHQKTSPVANTYYGGATGFSTGANMTIDMPIGKWRLQFTCFPYVVSTAAQTAATVYANISTTNNGASDTELQLGAVVGGASGTLNAGSPGAYKEKLISVTVKTTWYILLRTTTANMSEIDYLNNGIALAVRLVSAYL